MKQNIQITADSIIVNDKPTKWDNIVGFRRHDSQLIIQMSTRGPFCELLLEDGKVLRLNANMFVQGVNVAELLNIRVRNTRYKDYYAICEIIQQKATNINPNISNWIEWRLILPGIVAEIIILVCGVIRNSSMPTIIQLGLVGGVIFTLFGWLWEHKARKDLWGHKGRDIRGHKGCVSTSDKSTP